MSVTEEHVEVHETHSIPNLIRELRDEGIMLFRQEVALAKTEMSEKASRVARNSTYIGVGGAIAYAGLLFILAFLTGAIAIGLIAAGLEEWATPVAALIVGAVVCAIGAGMALKGKNALKKESAVPEKTVESLKEDRRWTERKIREERAR